MLFIVHGTGGGSNYHLGYKSTCGNAQKSYESPVKSEAKRLRIWPQETDQGHIKERKMSARITPLLRINRDRKMPINSSFYLAVCLKSPLGISRKGIILFADTGGSLSFAS